MDSNLDQKNVSTLHKAVIEEIEYMFSEAIIFDYFDEEQLCRIENIWQNNKKKIAEKVVDKLNFFDEIVEVLRNSGDVE